MVHIHNHSIYSINDSSAKPDELAKRAVELGIDTLVLTDHGNISGVIQMKKACKAVGIKFIPACEMYESPDRTEKSSSKKSKAEDEESANGIYHITMLPVNNQGWQDLQTLIADANTVGFHRKPRTDMHIIEEQGLGKNIIATSGCLGSFTSQLLLAGRYDEAKKEAVRRSKLFHAYFLEIQDNGSREQDMVNMQLIQMSQETGIPLVYAKDVHYVRAEDQPAHHTLVAMSRKQTIYECAPYAGTNTYHLASAEEVYDWADENNIPYEAIENTCKIADMCNVDLELGKDLMPDYPHCPPGHTPTTFIRKLLYDYMIEFVEKLNTRKARRNIKKYIKRLESELDTILLKGFPSYFLILWDILLWATNRKAWKRIEVNEQWLKENPDNAKYEFYPEYYVGPGRGSAAGSLVAYLLGITKLDPIEYDFMFERFLNPYRNSPPDIDTDFDGTNHDLLLDFVAQRYGRDRTAQILTFTKYKIRSSINFICKALEKKDANGKTIAYGYKVADEVNAVLKITGDQAKMPDQSDCTYKKMMEIAEKPEDYASYDNELPKYIEASKEFRKLMLKYPELHERLEKIEGCIQTSGIHAGGVIISKRPLALDCPTIMPREDSKAVLPITMWDYPDCEEVGLLKMDLLRTATLRIISLTVQFIEEVEGHKVDLYDIGRDDEATFDLICRGETHGLFQINGGGITKYTMQVQPRTQNEIIDILAIYRPGPLEAELENGNTIAEQYVLNGKRKPKEYLADVHESLREAFGASRGQMIYQEQVMAGVQIVAGYNLGHADSFRRVIGKKKIAEVAKLYDEFMYGHKYVIKKYEDLLAGWDDAKKVFDKKDKDKQTPLIEVKSAFDGKIGQLSKKDIENTLADTKKAMAMFEIVGAIKMGYDKKYARNLFKQMAKFAG